MFEHITKPRKTWHDAGKSLSPPRLEDRHLDAGIGFDFDRKYYFNFKTRKTGRWIMRKGFNTPDEALHAYKKLIKQEYFRPVSYE